MKTMNLKTAAASALACALALPAGAAALTAADGDYGDLSTAIAEYANANGIHKLLLAGFAAGEGAEKREAEYISEKTLAYLAGHKTPELVERSFFERALMEARASSAANVSPGRVKRYKELLSVDAVVTGTVLGAGGELIIFARVVDAKTGRVLFTAEAKSGREEARPAETRYAGPGGGIYSLTSELPGILVPDDPGRNSAAPPPVPADLRDAVAAVPKNSFPDKEGSCYGRKRQLRRLNSELVDAKAGYWAAKMRSPGFAGRGLGKNPGSEIEDPAVKARFYELLAGYYKAEPSVPPEPGKLARVARLIADEERFSGDCELQRQQ